MDSEQFYFIFQKLNEQRIHPLWGSDLARVEKMIKSHAVPILNRCFPFPRNQELAITTLGDSFLKGITNTKKKVFSFYRKLIAKHPAEKIVIFALPEEYKCYLPCHWKSATDRQHSWKGHNTLLCKEKQSCLQIHWDCEHQLHWPSIHLKGLDFSAWPGSFHTKRITLDYQTDAEADYHDLDVEFSYFLKSILTKIKESSYWESKGYNLDQPLIVFDWKKDDLQRKRRISINSTYYQKSKSKRLLKKNQLEVLINNLVQQRVRLNQQKRLFRKDRNLFNDLGLEIAKINKDIKILQIKRDLDKVK